MLLSATMAKASPGFRANWHSAWREPAFRSLLLGGLFLGAALMWFLPLFFRWVGQRPDRLLTDHMLALVGPADVSTITFTVLYGTLVVVLASVAPMPWMVLRGLYAYIIMVLLRVVAMAVVPLAPPPGIIPLEDPVTQVFYPDNTPFLKDLFFSGHTATLMIMALLARWRWAKGLAVAATILVGSLVLVQHVHWTVDVLAAVPAAWGAWWAAGRMLSRFSALPPAA